MSLRNDPARVFRLATTLGMLVAVLLLSLPAPGARAAGPTATFTKVSDWGTGFEGKYTIANPTSNPIDGWTVEFDLPAEVSISSHWEADMTRSGDHYTFVNRSYNGFIAPGGSTSFGFVGSKSGDFTEPANCTLNGAACDGSGDGGGGGGDQDTTAPTAPADLRVTSATSTTVSLAWSAATDNVEVTGYDVYRGSTLVDTTDATSYTVTGLTPDTEYAFTVRARDAAGNISQPSQSVSARTRPDDGGGGGDPGPYKKVAYFTQWGIYGRDFLVKDVDTSGAAAKLTHINYAFGNVNQQGECFEANQTGEGDAWADYQRRFTAAESVDGVGDTFNQPLAGNFNQLKELKDRHPQLEVLMSLGGWTWSTYFSNAALTAESRRAFAASCIDLFIKGNLPKLSGEPQGGPGAAAGVFDGIDIDWEWPASQGEPGNVVRPEDKHNFTLLLAELRRQLDQYGQQTGQHYLLTAFLPADPAKIRAGIEVDQVFQYLDYATIQGYDLHGPWENQTNHQSQLFSPPDDPAPQRFSVDLAIDTYIEMGAPAEELLVGVPAYGRGWQGVPSTNNGLYQSSSGPAPGTWENGVEDYKVLKNRAGQRFRDTEAGALWLYDGNQWWSYDDPQLLARKADYIKQRGLGGSMMWSLDGDDAQASLTSALDAALR